MKDFKSSLLTPHFKLANAELPGGRLLWETLLNQSDIFAFETAQYRSTEFGFIPKGGPFGAQLWLYHPESEDLVLVGTATHPEDSNAVVSKGLASAHAEAENLSPENRQKVVDFLAKSNQKDWKVVQISSGESCPACRSKQVLFANDLIARGLIKKGDFHVAFKATYEQTHRIANFNDEPYDNTFRVINQLRKEGKLSKFSDLGAVIQADAALSDMMQGGSLVHVPVHEGVLNSKASEQIVDFFGGVDGKPSAAVISQDGQTVLSSYVDTRVDRRGFFEGNAVVGSVHDASKYMREVKDKFMGAWDLERSVLVTNIPQKDLMPTSMAEADWSNLSGVFTLVNTPAHSELVRESDLYTNSQLFDMVAAPYNDGTSPIRVTYLGNDQESVAQHLWKLEQNLLEQVLLEQGRRLANLGDRKFSYIGGGDPVDLYQLVQSMPDGGTADYDGAKAGHEEFIPDFITLAA